MSTFPESAAAFSYQAQSTDGRPLSGTIDATSLDEAGERLAALGLRAIELHAEPRPPRPKPLRGEQFIAFNQQLAQLTSAGLPVEHGLRLIAQDMRSGRLATTIRQVAEELEAGRSLPEAFERHRGQFPPLYGRLIDAGVKTGDLPAMLLNLGRHMVLVQRLRAMLWQAASYPLIVLAALLLVIIFLGMAVLPQFEVIFKGFRTELPDITKLLIWMARGLPAVLVILVVAGVAVPLIWLSLRRSRGGRRITDQVAFALPLIGPVLKRNMLARWCDVMAMAVQAGMDLPAAIDMAGAAIGSPLLESDGQTLIAALHAGQGVGSIGRQRIIPATVPAAIDLGAGNNDLASVLDTLGQMYQQQAELRMNAIPAILLPLLIMAVAVIIGFVVLAMFAPMFALISAVSGGHF